MKSLRSCNKEGYCAKLKKQPITSCPYSLKSLRSRDRRAAWHKGYMKKKKNIPTNFNKRDRSCSLNLSFMKPGGLLYVKA